MPKEKEEPKKVFKMEDLVGEVIEPTTRKVLLDVVGVMEMSADVDGKTKTVSRELNGNESALFYMEEVDRTEFGDKEVDVTVNFEGYETFNERLPKKGLEEMEKVPYKFKPKRFTKRMKKAALVEVWPAKIKAMKAKITTK